MGLPVKTAANDKILACQTHANQEDSASNKATTSNAYAQRRKEEGSAKSKRETCAPRILAKTEEAAKKARMEHRSSVCADLGIEATIVNFWRTTADQTRALTADCASVQNLGISAVVPMVDTDATARNPLLVLGSCRI